MEDNNNSQLELFTESNNTQDSQRQKNKKPFLNRIWEFEKSILVIAGFIIGCIISFSLGVEKGKRLAFNINVSRLDIAKNVVPVQNKQVINDSKTSQISNQLPTEGLISKSKLPLNNQIAKQNAGENQQIAKNGNNSTFTIQLASYKTKINAQKEASILKAKGLNPLVLPKGKMTILCVGNFINQETAQSLLTQLRKRYADCRIRRL
ncbi:MAG: SPOR domain-containing protein [Candidatus Omnitrophica bacterium]|nr:SPOR domain-containing protein [Candidatus Omnitrophota bacterium]